MSKPFNPNTVETSVKDITFVGLDDFQLMIVALHIKSKKRALLSVKSLQMIDSLYRYETTTEPLSGMAISKLHAYFDKELVEMLLSKGAVLAGGMALSLADMDIETFRVGDGDFYILNEDKELYMECAHAIEEMMENRAKIEKNVFRGGSCVLDFYADCWTHPVSLIFSNKKSAAELILTFDYGYVQCAVTGKKTDSNTLEYELTKSCFAQECIDVKTNLYFRANIIHDGVFEKWLKKIYFKNYKVSDDVLIIYDFYPSKKSWEAFMGGRFYDHAADKIDKSVNTRDYIEIEYNTKKTLAKEKSAFFGWLNYTVNAQTVRHTIPNGILVTFFDFIDEIDHADLHLNKKKDVRFNRVGSPDEGWTLRFCPALHLIDKVIFNKSHLIQVKSTTTYEKKRKFEDDE
jgi:hypothetical protein